ncbi:NADH-quinone oxidoreductase subunit NuoE [Nocardioides massiliensis]|uniref:NADH-quinone oxidoreductase subunit E n=1 Tax=Nocardioides massiliensis TaxID=1325935 RepID=A0ABT9NJZ8_9ACTN|nr:NADH-quinone oxidoreductase subunit NuoE [Nocardioides massiliensis]MDP9820713.1 NADH-quinone oxidoreductase subunit E [Nocardioides massiliensis]
MSTPQSAPQSTPASQQRPAPDGASTAAEATALLPEQTMAELREIAARYPHARSGLLPMLHLVQSVEGRITPAGIEACAQVLGISAADVSGVATFYTMYKRRPVGDYHVGVCTNTLCAVMGGDTIFERLKDHLDVGNDETTEDGKITLEHLECNAACDFAPVMMVNWEFFDNMTPETAVEVVDDLRNGVNVHSTRGPKVVTWREAERVLAGFPDGLADDGPAAGPASLAGLEIAKEQGWSAPEGAAGAATGAAVSAGDADTRRAGSEAEVAASPVDVEHPDEPAQQPADEVGKGDDAQ